jgi:NAD(P)H dehydrogenase (quinone)
MPAIMRGYLDRVFSYGFAYTAGKNGTLGLFNHKRVVMVNTIGASSAQYSANGMLSALETIANPGIFNFCGTKVERFFHLAGIPSSSAAERQQMLADVHDFFRNLK